MKPVTVYITFAVLLVLALVVNSDKDKDRERERRLLEQERRLLERERELAYASRGPLYQDERRYQRGSGDRLYGGNGRGSLLGSDRLTGSNGRKIKCRDKEEYLSCGSACEPSCANPNPRICTYQCVSGCFCKRGLLRDGNRCVKASDCRRTGRSDSVFKRLFRG